MAYTKEDRKEYMRRWRKTPKAKQLRLKHRLKKAYGISIKEYEHFHRQSNGVCAICGLPEKAIDRRTGDIRPLSLDHCHKTNEVRGVLCHNCNIGLGGFHDNIDVMASAISYLVNAGIVSSKKEAS